MSWAGKRWTICCVFPARSGEIPGSRLVHRDHRSVPDDGAAMVEGQGRRMRHVKLRPGKALDEEALAELIIASYHDIRRRLGTV